VTEASGDDSEQLCHDAELTVAGRERELRAGGVVRAELDARQGAAIGGVAGLAAVTVANARTSPETSAVAVELVTAATTSATKPSAVVVKSRTKRRR
jgi:hypothetical protein